MTGVEERLRGITVLLATCILVTNILMAPIAAKSQESFTMEWRGGTSTFDLLKGSPKLYLEKGIYNISYIDSDNLRLLLITKINYKTIIEASLEETRRSGRIYPLFNITITKCPSGVKVYRGAKNITDLVLSSRAFYFTISERGCTIIFNGLRIYSLGYITDEGFMIFNLTSNSSKPYYIVVGYKGLYPGQVSSNAGEVNTVTVANRHGNTIESPTITMPLQEPVKITYREDSLWGSKMKYLIGLVLSILMVASLVYEYGRARKSG